MKLKSGSINWLKYSLVASAIASISTPAQAITFNFKNIFPINSSSELSGDGFVDKFSFELTDAGNGEVLFQFFNNSNVGSIGDIYFEDSGNILSNMRLNVGNTGNVNFSNISPGTLPQGNKIGFDEVFGAKFSGGGAKRVNKGESLGIKFKGDFNNVVYGLGGDGFRVGIHVQELTGGRSDSFVNEPVPEPLSVIGSIAGLGSVLIFNRRLSKSRRKSQD